MFRHFGAALRRLPLRTQVFPIQQFRATSWVSGLEEEILNEQDVEAAREWALNFKETTIPKSLARIRFDRSSGKGGQHVNTTSSKATCFWEMKSISSYVPEIFHQELRKSSYYAPSSDTLVIQSQSSRSQHDNKDECYRKLHQLLVDVGKRVIPGKTTSQQKKKVEQMQKADNDARLRMKKQRSSKKLSRYGGNLGDY